MTTDTEQVLQALQPVQDPELHRSIVDLGMVRNISIDDTTVEVEIALTIAGCPMRTTIEQSVTEAISGLDDRLQTRISFGVMTDEERARVTEVVHGRPSETAGSLPAHGHAEGRLCLLYTSPSPRDRG